MARQSVGMPAIAATALLFAATLAAPAADLAVNGDFNTGTQGWWATPNLSLSVRDGALCADVPGGLSNPWDAIIGQDNVPLERGQDYRLAFTAAGEPEGPVRALVQMPKPPYTFYVEAAGVAGPDGAERQAGFTSPVTIDDAQIVMQVGGSSKSWTVCLDNVLLDSGKAVAYAPDTGPRVRVNQVGYLPDGPKHATLATDATDPLPWRLLDANGDEVLSGRTVPRGVDPSAGLNVHIIDFSAAKATGEGFVLEADGDRGYPFPIRADIYAGLPRDALGYFYPVRSGVAIDGAIAGEAYARPAGHVSAPGDGNANKGDRDVPCQSPESSEKAYGEPWTCAYTLDVTGGWYDAGDHGKYVVNGGISVAQLMDAYERARAVDNAPPAAKADSALAIPETGNGVPDILDEARWELEFMVKMMAPDGEPLAGMVHHKVHDAGWTGLPTLPDRDDRIRELHRPSTAATLNLAAAAAQGARLFEPFDQAFSEKLLAAARKAYEAAKAHPALLAPGSDGASGGGAYDDADVTDEFYWAAAELFITTGENAYLSDLRASPYWTAEAFRPGGFDWANVAALGRMALATLPSKLPEKDADAARKSVIAAANRYLAMQSGQPFGQIYAPANGEYDWGSNHLMLQNAIVVARAYDLTGDRKYRDAVIEGVDYIFGRNALNRSYVTGYGKVYSRNQHSRWFAHQLDPDLPNPPKGSLAGGPNSGIQDPVAQRMLKGCAPQFCYIDDIESWSTNEITINWNAALAEIAAFLAEQ